MVLYFGDPRGALALLERGVPLAGVVHGRRGGPGWRTLLPRLEGVPRWLLPDLDDPVVIATLSALRPELVVSAFYPRRIPEPILALAPGLNVHPSDLPRWRGPDPCHWTIRAGDRRTAICVHRLTAEIDAGDVMLREPHEVRPRETAGALAARLEARGAELIAGVADRWLAGDPPPARPQTGPVTWAPQVAPEDLEIDWTRPAEEVDRLVRASSPEPGAFTGIGDKLLVVLAGRPTPAQLFAALPPATPFVRAGRPFVRCGDEAYEFVRVRLGRRTLSGQALARLLV